MNTDEANGGIAAAASGKLSGKRTEADIYATFMSVSVFCNFGDFFVTCIAKTLPRIYLSLRAITAVTAVCGGKAARAYLRRAKNRRNVDL